MTEQIVKSRFFSRISEIIVPVLTWVIITLPLWLSPFHPAVVAYFIIAFDLYFFYKSLNTTYLAVLSYKKILVHMRISYAKKILIILLSSQTIKSRFINLPQQLARLLTMIILTKKNSCLSSLLKKEKKKPKKKKNF